MLNYLLAIGQSQGLEQLQRSASQKYWQSHLPGARLALLAVVAVLAVAYVVHVVQRRRRFGTLRDPNKLFHFMLRKLDLAHEERRLLQTLATASHLEHPVAMLLSPALLARWGYQWANDPVNTAGRHAGLELLSRLCTRLFDEPLPSPEVVDSGSPVSLRGS